MAIKKSALELIKMAHRGDRFTIRTPQGQEVSGKTVMKSDPKYGPGWVLNLGGAHGRPGLANEKNIVKATIDRKQYVVESKKPKMEKTNFGNVAIGQKFVYFPDDEYQHIKVSGSEGKSGKSNSKFKVGPREIVDRKSVV